jgi:hypothetical protein
VYHNLEEAVMEQLLSRHSERLAIAFGVLNTSPEIRLIMMKNLKVCGEAAGGGMWGRPPMGDSGI